MANVGPNQGRRLKTAISRFTAMLIREARDLTGLSYEKLDEALGLTSGNSYRYSLDPSRPKSRAVQIGGIQSLENRVARLLRRPAHLIAVVETHELDALAMLYRMPVANLGLPRHVGADDIELIYDNYWPTYADLSRDGRFDIECPWADQPELFRGFGWQWGCLWDEAPNEHRQKWCSQFRQIPRHWLSYWCEQVDISEDLATEILLPLIVQKMSENPGLIDRWTGTRTMHLRERFISATTNDLVGPPGWGNVAETFVDIFLEEMELPDHLLPEICRSSGVTANQL